MNTSILFTTLIFSVAGLHIAWKMIEFVNRLYEASGRRYGASKKKTKRGDWYMFFHRSDLTGKTQAPSNKRADERKKTSVTSAEKQGSRPPSRQYLF